ncbi:hypothetical protein D910_06288 [Dendroctonus ponderosae]|uniref:CBS domain-containing protein n=1 Tax=Dendroctonus ponderosae TaxID=77166 RepID=U4U788_DENPD|nr:hypothetical protein D910_06288 [Dendroctonus ponderosae]
MSTTSEANGTISCPKRTKVGGIPTFHSPLSDIVAPPSYKSKCTWNRPGNNDQINPHNTEDWRRESKLLPNILHSIGNTPMVKLNKIPQSAGIKANIYVKCEYFNPGGSVKDRIGFRMVEDAERQGLLKPGYTIIEPTSGNTGIGLALAAAVKGYRCIVVMSEKMSNEKVSTLRALGAEIVRTPVNLDSFAPGGMFGVTHELHKTIPNSVILDQYSNPGNPLAHYDTTAEEIFDQCDQQVAMIVIGAGTGGTVCGIGRKFKEISPQTKIVAADPEGSVLALPDDLNKTDVTFYELDISGSSSGANVVAALEAAKDLEQGQNVVVILPDSIRNYMTKFVSDEWMQARGYMPCENTHNHWWWYKTIADLKLPTLQVATSSMTADKAVQLMRQLSVDQIPVVDNDGSIIGMVTLQKLMTAMMTKRLPANSTLESHIVRVYPKLYDSAFLGLICSVLEKEPYVILLKKAEGDSGVDKPVSIVTPMDVLSYISGKPN